MQVSVLVKTCETTGFCATCLTFPGVVAHGMTRELALDALRQAVLDQVADGEVTQIDVPSCREPNPWLALAGTWKDNPEIAEVEANIRAYRRQVDEDPERL